MFSLKKNYCTILRGGGGTFEVEYQNTQLVHDEKDEITSKFTTRRRGEERRGREIISASLAI
jgi:hypothetical protein